MRRGRSWRPMPASPPGSDSVRCAPAWPIGRRPIWPKWPRPSTSCPGTGRDGHRRRVVRARMAGLRLRVPAAEGATRPAARGRGDHATDVDDRLRNARRDPLPGRWGAELPVARAGQQHRGQPGERHSPVDRRWGREGHPPHSRTVCRLHELRRWVVAGLRAQGRAPQGHCAAVGRDDAEITRSTNLDVVIGHSQGEIDDRLAGIRDRLERGGVPQDKVEARMRHYATSPGCGTPSNSSSVSPPSARQGLGYAIANFAEAAYDTSGVEAFEREVIPELA